ncbi:hypothetical protein HGRIS_013992 [Hohenbuehelia grisea]|uniref:Nephrocystin 3-like N-terminal domain-containing protein n=1 Tax=Hohenbuehelia grisea TaxID=104357 RepID=A0ABR3JU02_9AGAR
MAQMQDGQVAVFKTLETVLDHFGSKVVNVAADCDWITCTPNTRVSVLQIEEWALAPASQNTLLLYGSPGKGKSTIIHTIRSKLHSKKRLAAMPYFAFNRSLALLMLWTKAQ